MLWGHFRTLGCSAARYSEAMPLGNRWRAMTVTFSGENVTVVQQHPGDQIKGHCRTLGWRGMVAPDRAVCACASTV